MAASLKACGPAVLVATDGVLEKVVSVISLIITRSHPCQQDLGEEEEEPEVDAGSSEYDWLVIDTALDVMVSLAAALGPAFGELWKVFEKPVSKLSSSTEDVQRSTAVGTIAEVIKYTGDAMTPYTDSLGQVLARRLGDPDPLTKSNATYAIGLLILHSSETGKTIPMYLKLWERLEPLLSMREMRITDNVAGCLCRMMMKHPDDVFVSQALPAVVDILPLQEDYEENEPIYQCVYKLCESFQVDLKATDATDLQTDAQSNQTAQDLTPKLVDVFEKVMGPPEDQLEQETRGILQKTVQLLFQAKPDLFSNHTQLLRYAGLQ